MPEKPTYEQLEQRILKLEETDFKRKQAEEKLQISEILLKETQRISKTGGWEYDVQTNVSTFTDMIFEIYGETFSDPKEGIKFYHKDDRMVVVQSFENAIAKKKPYDIEVRFINAQGDNLWVRTIGKPMVEDGKVVKILGNLVDITDRKQAEKALQESEKRLAEAQKMAKLGYYIFDFKTDCWISSTELDDIFGINDNYNKNTVSWLQIVHPDHLEKMSSYFQDNILTQHQNFDKEYKIINKRSGTEIWVHGLGDLKFDENNKPVEMFGTIQDITERKRLINDLKNALDEIKTLKGIVPICSNCKKIRDDKGYWNILESYIQKHSEASFSHSMCPECSDKLYGDENWYIEMKKKKENE